VAAAAIAGAALSWLWLRPTKTGARPPTRLNIDLSPSAPLPTASDTSVLIAISPDGTEIVYQSVGPRLYSRSLSRPTAVPVPGIDRGWGPFFSPDGRWLGFSADGKLQKVATTGGTPRVLAEAPWLRGASWAEDATIVYTPTAWSGLFRVSAEGGEPQRLTEPDPQSETSHRFPQVLPGGQSVIYTIHAPSGRDDDARVAALSLPTGIRKVLVKGGTYGRYVPTGHFLYASGGTVFAAPFDARRLEVTGPAAAVLEDVRMGANSTGAAQLDFSTSGTLVYITPHDRPRQRSLAWVDRKGSVVSSSSERRPFRNIRLSPDGRRLIAEIESSNGVDLWLHETSRQTWTRLTFEKDNFSPVWSPDGTRIAFASNRTGARNLFWMPAEGGAAKRITTSPQWQDATDWPPEEGVLIFQQLERENGWDIWDISLDGNRRARPLMETRFSEWDGVISPDGRWLAFGSNESGRAEVYVRAYHDDRVGRKWLVSTNGGWEPHWSRTGRELFYRNVDRLMSVAVSEGPTFRAAEPVALFERPFVTYDVAPDGKRFVLLEDAEQEPERLQVVVIPDWFEELKARVPVPR
jgi:serine/threonine-protein kinase